MLIITAMLTEESRVKEILIFLAAFGCHPTAEVRQVEALSHPGAYVNGQVLLRRDADLGVAVHELAHACGRDEAGAHRLEMLWRSRDV